MKFSIQTLGCKINQFDAGLIKDRLVASGATQATPGEPADVSVIYTCTVTNKSDYRCRQAIRHAVDEKPLGGIVVVAGCYAQTSPEEIKAIPGVDFIVGNEDKDRLSGLILNIAQDRPTEGFAAETLSGRSRAFLKVQDGCESFCSYCIVPFARGRRKSALPDEIMQVADGIISRGYNEIVLTGVHLGAYGIDLAGGINLALLIKRLLDRPGLGRLRLSSIEPMEVSDELIEVVTSCKVCRHFHIPLQSGDDAVLESMGRGYTWAQYFDIVNKLALNIPGACIGADVIVGYPVEDTTSFSTTLSRITDSPINHLHVFSYSPRPGTKAEALGDPVRGDEKKRRSRLLREVGAVRNRAFKESFIGKQLDVVVEEGGGSGLSDNYIRIRFDGEGLERKSQVRVRLDVVGDEFCEGTVIS